MKYEKPELEVIELKKLDVIKTSDPNAPKPVVPGNGDNEDDSLNGDF